MHVSLAPPRLWGAPPGPPGGGRRGRALPAPAGGRDPGAAGPRAPPEQRPELGVPGWGGFPGRGGWGRGAAGPAPPARAGDTKTAFGRPGPAPARCPPRLPFSGLAAQLDPACGVSSGSRRGALGSARCRPRPAARRRSPRLRPPLTFHRGAPVGVDPPRPPRPPRGLDLSIAETAARPPRPPRPLSAPLAPAGN